jgi:hypothetical protein
LQQTRKTFAATYGKAKTQGEHWQEVGMSLLDLRQVDQDLVNWSKGKIEGAS